MTERELLTLAVACAALLALCGVLAGIWLGFRVVTRDASLLAATGARADGATALARAAMADVKALAEAIEDHAERMERKRASIAGTLSKLEGVREAKEKGQDEAQPQLTGDPLAGLTGAARRLAGQRLVNSGLRGV